jgi:hypothetical protein
MSRFNANTTTAETFVYGWDHALGYFYEIWENEDMKEEKCYLFNRLSRGEMLEKMVQYGAKKSHIEAVALDLPF